MNEDLVKRFAPILFLDPEEKFAPVDPKRFFEHANLWMADVSLDDKTMWGGAATAAFPRQPLVAAGGLKGVASEADGTLIDDASLLPPTPTAEAFLELGGWKDASEMHESDVTVTSSNVYADRDSIADKYTDDELRESRFWYYAEMFEGDDLKAVLTRPGTPDLSPYVKDEDHRALLCYYYFFPAHQQSVSQDYCDNLGSKEAACHAGDWQCVAILLKGDGSGATDKYTPIYFGCTGSGPEQQPPGTEYLRPYAFDDDGYTVMKVEKWAGADAPAMGMPQTDQSDHPRFYVSLGTHSFYTTPGRHDALPFRPGEHPQWCGKFDTPSVMPHGWGQHDSTGEDLGSFGAFFAKFMTGLGVGGAPGAVVGALAASAEGNLGVGINVTGTSDVPDPEQAPDASGALAITPQGIVPKGAGLAVEEWKVRQGLSIGNRNYDYLVDRQTQRWWPNPDMETGFRGRWGQRVTSDFLPRRAGPRFPDYLKVFFLALAAGYATKQFTD